MFYVISCIATGTEKEEMIMNDRMNDAERDNQRYHEYIYMQAPHNFFMELLLGFKADSMLVKQPKLLYPKN